MIAEEIKMGKSLINLGLCLAFSFVFSLCAPISANATHQHIHMAENIDSLRKYCAQIHEFGSNDWSKCVESQLNAALEVLEIRDHQTMVHQNIMARCLTDHTETPGINYVDALKCFEQRHEEFHKTKSH